MLLAVLINLHFFTMIHGVHQGSIPDPVLVYSSSLPKKYYRMYFKWHRDSNYFHEAIKIGVITPVVTCYRPSYYFNAYWLSMKNVTCMPLINALFALQCYPIGVSTTSCLSFWPGWNKTSKGKELYLCITLTYNVSILWTALFHSWIAKCALYCMCVTIFILQ